MEDSIPFLPGIWKGLAILGILVAAIIGIAMLFRRLFPGAPKPKTFKERLLDILTDLLPPW